MQWTGERNGGCSRADFEGLVLPPIMDASFGYQAINVEQQLRTPGSLLRWIKRMIALRASHEALGLGLYEPVYPEDRGVCPFHRR